MKVNTILWANNLTRKSIIKPGQVIVLLPIDGILHEIQKGETIGMISMIHKADIRKIIDYNNIADSTKIYPGDQIIIPDGQPLILSEPENYNVAKTSVNTTRKQLTVKIPSAQVVSENLLWPTSAKTITQGYKLSHRGIDIANGGTPPIYASHAGTIEFAGYKGDWGKTILLRRDDGLVTRYSHESEIYIKVGQRVNTGDIIGKIGNTGRVRGRTGLHLDFRVYVKGIAINPQLYLK